MSDTTTRTALQQQAVALVEAAHFTDPLGLPADLDTASFLVALDEDGEDQSVIDFASPAGLEEIAMANFATVPQYLDEVNGDPDWYGVRITVGGLDALA